eukprot:scaffold91413_cov17-Tisochrysis_lutea.AAC.1
MQCKAQLWSTLWRMIACFACFLAAAGTIWRIKLALGQRHQYEGGRQEGRAGLRRAGAACRSRSCLPPGPLCHHFVHSVSLLSIYAWLRAEAGLA